MAQESTGGANGRRRRTAIWAGVAGLLVGLLLGAAAGGSSTKTVTDVQHDATTETTTVPVEHVKTVTKVRRVVRYKTKTVTVHAQPVSGSGGGGGGSGSGASDGSQYAGMTCAEIGHSFTVTPGSDPEHDRDGDGIACEAYP
jgi:hypothetical protein